MLDSTVTVCAVRLQSKLTQTCLLTLWEPWLQDVLTSTQVLAFGVALPWAELRQSHPPPTEWCSVIEAAASSCCSLADSIKLVLMHKSYVYCPHRTWLPQGFLVTKYFEPELSQEQLYIWQQIPDCVLTWQQPKFASQIHLKLIRRSCQITCQAVPHHDVCDLSDVSDICQV